MQLNKTTKFSNKSYLPVTGLVFNLCFVDHCAQTFKSYCTLIHIMWWT